MTKANEMYRGMGSFQRIVYALIISVLWNSFLIVVTSAMAPADLAYSKLGRMMSAFGRPGGIFTEWFFPGHSMQQVVVIIVSSVIFYWILFLFVLTGASWLLGTRPKLDVKIPRS